MVTVLVPCRRDRAKRLTVNDHLGQPLYVVGRTEVFRRRPYVVAKLVDAKLGFDLVEFADGKKCWVNPVPVIPNSEVQA
jgi:hypothetical protein